MSESSKMPLREAIAWASTHPDFFHGVDKETMQMFLNTACEAIEEKMKRDGVSILSGEQNQ